MKTITALDAKNAFGQLLEAAQREPVMVSKNGRPVAAMISVHDLQALAEAVLPVPELDRLKGISSPSSLLEALMRQSGIDRAIERGRGEISRGEGIDMDDSYFEKLKARAHRRGR